MDNIFFFLLHLPSPPIYLTSKFFWKQNKSIDVTFYILVDLLYSLDHIEDIQLLFIEFIILFNLKPTTYIYFNYEFYKTVQFIIEF